MESTLIIWSCVQDSGHSDRHMLNAAPVTRQAFRGGVRFTNVYHSIKGIFKGCTEMLQGSVHKVSLFKMYRTSSEKDGLGVLTGPLFFSS